MIYKKIAACFLTIVLCLNVIGGAAFAADKTAQPPQNTVQPVILKTKSAILIEQSTGKVLYEMNAHEKLPPASITKIMTELLVLEAIENKTISFDDKVTCSEHAASMGGSDIWLEPNEVMTVRDLFKAMAINSANDAAVALAEKVAGTEQAFVNMMNEKVKELSMNDTFFVNSNGLDAKGHLTSAYDVAIVSRELLKHKEIFSYCTVWMDTLREGKTALYNTNRLIRFYNGANGLKTGSTGTAGYCVSATALRGNMQLIAVIMGSDNSDDRFNSAKNLLEYGFTNWAAVTPKLPSQSMQVRVLKGVMKSVEIVPGENIGVLVDKGKEKKIEQKISLVTDVLAPVDKGQILGQITLWVDGKNIGAIPLIAKQSVDKLTFGRAFLNLIKGFVCG
jgi:D-alanyl-D-alanine carboxypeptidase (penicillin-binding protein 5/6)